MLVVQEFVSVDGFAADASGEFDFAGVIPDWSAIDADQLGLLDRVGLLVLGRRTYELFVAFWPTAEHVLAEPINITPKAVISQRQRAATWGDWPGPTVHPGPLADTIRELTRTAAPKDLLVWGSLNLTAALLREGLVDELRLIVCPVALGSGIGVVPADLGRSTLKPVGATPYPNGAVQLTYRV